MPAKKTPTGTDKDLNLSMLAGLFVNEDKAREFLENRRWPNGDLTCPHCEAQGAYRITAKAGSKRPVRPGVFKCRGCRKQFTVRVGTVFEDSKIPLSKWLMALHLMSSSKKGISSHQIARELGITVKSAWFVTMRIREAMRDDGSLPLDGTVEIDECYVGGKPRPGNNGKPGQKAKPKRGRGTEKQPVMVLVERGGKSKAMPIAKADGETLMQSAREHVAKTAAIVTDEWAGYRGLGAHFDGGHRTVNHGKGEYVRYEDAGATFVSTNTAESWFALLKRAFIGIHHKMSKKHLHRYCDERSFMWGHRELTDGERMVAAIQGAEGKRLMYG